MLVHAGATNLFRALFAMRLRMDDMPGLPGNRWPLRPGQRNRTRVRPCHNSRQDERWHSRWALGGRFVCAFPRPPRSAQSLSLELRIVRPPRIWRDVRVGARAHPSIHHSLRIQPWSGMCLASQSAHDMISRGLFLTATKFPSLEAARRCANHGYLE